MFRETCIISIRCAVAKAPAVGRAGAGIYSKFPDMGCSEVPQVFLQSRYHSLPCSAGSDFALRASLKGPHWKLQREFRDLEFLDSTDAVIKMATHCYDFRRPIFKNDYQLTYHKTLADQITNASCPSCGAIFEQDPTYEEEEIQG